MATATIASPDSTTPSEADPAAPLLGPRGTRSSARGGPILSGAARFLRQASSRRMMGEPSVAVRESAAEHLEDRRSDWAYSRPVVVLDVLWNFAFVATSGVVLAFSRNERPCLPLRIWIAGYALQCVLHIACVCVEYRRRHPHRDADGVGSGSGRLRSGFISPMNVGESSGQEGQDENQTRSAVKHLESANTMFSFVWWIIGFYWVSAGGEDLTRDCPQLYWLCIIFLAFDVIFVVCCVALACVVGIAVCCCLPCIIAILYAVADQQEGASEEDIRLLPKYKFQGIINSEKLGGEISESSGGIMTECESDPPIEHVLSAEDAECCICLSPYDDGVELRELPCSHHFHCACIDKWLYINATCPLCKFNIMKSNNNGAEEV